MEIKKHKNRRQYQDIKIIIEGESINYIPLNELEMLTIIAKFYYKLN